MKTQSEHTREHGLIKTPRQQDPAVHGSVSGDTGRPDIFSLRMVVTPDPAQSSVIDGSPKPIRSLTIITGLSGSGKSAILRYLETHYHHTIHVIKKFTTRPRRSGEERYSSHIHITRELFQKLKQDPRFLSHQLGGHEYGFFVDQIFRYLSAVNVSIMIRDPQVIHKLIEQMDECSWRVHVILLNAEEARRREFLRQEYKARGVPIDDAAINTRLNRDRKANAGKPSDLIDYQILENDGTLDDLVQQFLRAVDGPNVNRLGH